ncbi:LysR family transcriptional regulator [Saccharomonospora piscinae]|uniref:LysR family transcriptional regulator n=1 Tax=Saccharomonospora piscinae TaxID=687388 RepID=A0A1V9A9M9_SACPI|nr:LysR family transcriptional regulator [Saccharomonospora piscinae]OQO93768.1 LysR family transcriptional regulator [Saccharomonospora piscinae]TLW94932.1 LysR family transcriptional regulator [Saccharomonospora piscinae]
MVDVGRLRVLRAVVAKRSIRAAAEALDYTPSAVSQQLAALQRETGLRLIERVGRGVEPTAAARTLAAESQSLFRELSRLDGLASDLRAGRTGSLSIGYFASAGAAWLPSVVTVLREEFPELRLDLRWTEVLDEPADDLDIDVFVESPWSREYSGDAVVHRLVDDPYEVVLREDDPLAARETVPLAELAGRAWIDNDLSHGACREVLLAACAEVGFVPRFSVEMRDYRTAVPFVSTGIGVTVLPALARGELPAGLTSRPVVSPVPMRRISVGVRRSGAENAAVLRAVELLREAVTSGARASLTG